MKKEIAVLILLFLLISGGFANAWKYDSACCEISKILTASGRWAGDSDMERALSELSSAYSRFLNYRDYFSFFSGKAPVAELDGLFLNLRQALSKKELAQASAAYAELLNSLSQLSRAQSLNLVTIF